MSTLVLAVPSKGRLQENAHAFFARAGMKIVQPRGARDYRGRIAGLDGVEVAFLSASEIARGLSAGTVHLGITGEDLLREEIPDSDERVHLVTPLGFGRADVVVAVPDAWIDVRTMDDLDDVAALLRAREGRRLRVATKYIALTRAFFARHRLGDYRIVESLGATEGAPAAGSAEIIVDITTTGATLAANGLRIVDDGVILKSEANLAASLGATWGDGERSALRELLGRVAAEEAARRTRFVRFLADDPGPIVKAARERFALSLPFGADCRPVILQASEGDVSALVALLKEAGLGTVSIEGAEAVFAPENPLLEGVLARIRGG